MLLSGVRANLAAWIEKLECGGDLEKQAFFKKRFIQRLRDSPVAIDTEKANEQHYEVPTEFFLTVSSGKSKMDLSIFKFRLYNYYKISFISRTCLTYYTSIKYIIIIVYESCFCQLFYHTRLEVWTQVFSYAF